MTPDAGACVWHSRSSRCRASASRVAASTSPTAPRKAGCTACSTCRAASLNLEKNLDRNPSTGTAIGAADSASITLAATTRVAGLAEWGAFLVAAEHRSDGLWLEVFDVRPMLHRQQSTTPALPSRGAFRFTTGFTTSPNQYQADVTMHRGCAVVTVNANGASIPGSTGANTFIVDLRALFDDDSTTSVPATAVQAVVPLSSSQSPCTAGNGDAVNRAVRAQVTVRGTRAWVLTNKTMRSYELE